MRFRCKAGCLKCCEKKGFVYLAESDVANIARFLKLSAHDFEQRYVYRTKYLRRFRKPRQGQCPFLSTEGCKIHPVKPAQCRAFPLWPEIVENAKELSSIAKWCPGIGKGAHLRSEDIEAATEQMRKAYPTMYED